MVFAASISPFTHVNDEPWVLWTNKQTVTSLQKRAREEKTNNPAQDENTTIQPPMPTPTYDRTPQIRRSQYNSVLSRMKQATKNSGQFATWIT